MRRIYIEYFSLLVLIHIAMALLYSLFASSNIREDAFEFVPWSAITLHGIATIFSVPLVCFVYLMEKKRGVSFLPKVRLFLLFIFCVSVLVLLFM